MWKGCEILHWAPLPMCLPSAYLISPHVTNYLRPSLYCKRSKTVLISVKSWPWAKLPFSAWFIWMSSPTNYIRVAGYLANFVLIPLMSWPWASRFRVSHTGSHTVYTRLPHFFMHLSQRATRLCQSMPQMICFYQLLRIVFIILHRTSRSMKRRDQTSLGITSWNMLISVWPWMKRVQRYDNSA